jgi:hypothetical protein
LDVLQGVSTYQAKVGLHPKFDIPKALLLDMPLFSLVNPLMSRVSPAHPLIN